MTASTAAIANISISDNATFQDAIQFGDPDNTGWTLGPNLKMEVKASRDDLTALATFQTSDSTMVIDSAALRVFHFNVPDSTIQSELPPAEYVYDLVMFDNSVPPLRTLLMQGVLTVRRGVTEN